MKELTLYKIMILILAVLLLCITYASDVRINQYEKKIDQLESRIERNTIGVDYALNVAEACAERLGVKINSPLETK